MITTWKVIRYLGAPVLLLAPALMGCWPSTPTPGPRQNCRVFVLWLSKGSIRDEIVLAGDYFTGSGVERDPKMAAYWYEKAAGHGSPEAQNQIGYFYQAGIGVTRDSKRAFHWYQLAVVLRATQSQGQFGDCVPAWVWRPEERRYGGATVDAGLPAGQRYSSHISWVALLLRNCRK